MSSAAAQPSMEIDFQDLTNQNHHELKRMAREVGIKANQKVKSIVKLYVSSFRSLSKGGQILKY